MLSSFVTIVVGALKWLAAWLGPKLLVLGPFGKFLEILICFILLRVVAWMLKGTAVIISLCLSEMRDAKPYRPLRPTGIGPRYLMANPKLSRPAPRLRLW